MMDIIKPVLRKQPDVIVLHSGTNDISNNVNTLKQIKKLVNFIKEVDSETKETKIAISGIINRTDNDYRDAIRKINDSLRTYCQNHNHIFIDNENVDETCLNRSNLHLNKKGNSYFANNIIDSTDVDLWPSGLRCRTRVQRS